MQCENGGEVAEFILLPLSPPALRLPSGQQSKTQEERRQRNTGPRIEEMPRRGARKQMRRSHLLGRSRNLDR